MLSLSAPQNTFLNGLNTKYRAYVGGFGCVHPDTKVWTEHGLMRIAEITSAVRVLSWNQKSQRFQISLSGGSFPKGKANLYRVVTQQGEFVATSHHRSFSSDCNYQSVGDMSAGMGLSLASQDLLRSISEFGLKSFPVDDQHLNQKHVDLMQSYADAARLYGQQLLMAEDSGQAFAQESACARISGHMTCRHAFLHLDDQEGRTQEHSHHGQSFCPSCMQDCDHQSAELGAVEARCASSLPSEHTLRCHQSFQQSGSTFSRHHTTIKQLAHEQDQNLFSAYKPPIEQDTILAVLDAERNHVYYDMQVLDTNNYVDEFGFIHHNSGKTFVGCLDLLIFAARHPKTVQGYFGTSYPSIRDIFYPTFSEAAELMGFRVEIIESHKEVHIYRGRVYYGTVICRSMDNPGSIVGFKIARALVDEIDTLPKKKAHDAWNKIVARLRLVIDGVENGIGVTTTPEGFLFVYEKFKQDPTPSYSMVQASTYENAEYLPPDYISTLLETYPSGLIQAYLRGQFVNLTSGSVYPEYDRAAKNSLESIQAGERLHIGMDFNVNKMAACVFVERANGWHCVEEITNGQDTPYMINLINEKWKSQGHKIIIYPDASGKNTSSKGASISDVNMLQMAGFEVRAHDSNPRVKDRVNCVNRQFSAGRLWINSLRCPNTAKCIEQQAYDDNGEPDKKSGLDHKSDAFGYPLAYTFPVIKPMARGPRAG